MTTPTNSLPWSLPAVGGNPGSTPTATTPGSFANRAAIAPGPAGAATYSSPDTPGMPPLPAKTAWDFLPDGWESAEGQPPATNGHAVAIITQADGSTRWVTHPHGFIPSTQLEHARLGHQTPQMRRVAEREPHLTAAQVRDEVAAGRMVIPANKQHLGHQLDPMCIGRASKTKINANMGASPVASSIDEEVDKLKWAERWQ
ncbi:MAG: phosphomethylpyrimidine synthase ThiC, partial [Planctomycetota bacterium]